MKKLFDRAIAFNRVFVDLTGSVTSALLLSQACYWSQRTTSEDGWFYKTQEEWEEETGLTRYEFENARKKAEKYLKYELRGLPAKGHYFVDWEAIYQDCGISANKIGENQQTRLGKTSKHSITENTTENTSSFEKIQSDESIDNFLGFPLPEGWTNDSYIDEVDNRIYNVKDEFGLNVNATKLKKMKQEYEKRTNPRVSKENAPEVDFELFTGIWNSYPDLKTIGIKECNNPSANYGVLPPAKITPDLKKLIKQYAKKYDLEQWKHAIEEYVKEILNRSADERGYYQHRMSFYDFLYQKNGFTKFVNK